MDVGRERGVMTKCLFFSSYLFLLCCLVSPFLLSRSEKFGLWVFSSLDSPANPRSDKGFSAPSDVKKEGALGNHKSQTPVKTTPLYRRLPQILRISLVSAPNPPDAVLRIELPSNSYQTRTLMSPFSLSFKTVAHSPLHPLFLVSFLRYHKFMQACVFEAGNAFAN